VAKHSPLGRVLAAGLRNVKSSREVMKEAIEEAGRGVTHELERFLTSLGTIASIAPLMGLFGTVVGMIEIFGSRPPPAPIRSSSPTASRWRSTTPVSAC
jgi:biopolymer transport protein ExbB